MKIRMIRTHKVMEVEKSYGMRLIEQGKAVIERPNCSVRSADKIKEEARRKKVDEACP